MTSRYEPDPHTEAARITSYRHRRARFRRGEPADTVAEAMLEHVSWEPVRPAAQVVRAEARQSAERRAMTALQTAISSIRSGPVPDPSLSPPFLTIVPGDGASVATFGTFAGNETISITDSRAGRIDQLQFDLNEGPCWEALQQGQPVVEPDVRDHPSNRWPTFLPAVADDGVGALFAVPLRFGPFLLGAVDVYARTPLHVSAAAATAAMTLADAVSREVLRRLIIDRGDADPGRYLLARNVHQATGIVLAHLGLTPTDAYLLIQGHAAARNETTADTAEQILAGELRITPDGDLAPSPPTSTQSRQALKQ